MTRLKSMTDEAVQQHIDQISEIKQAVNSLEKAAYSLDAYSKQLGNVSSFSSPTGSYQAKYWSQT